MNKKGFVIRDFMWAFIGLAAIIAIGFLMVQGLGTKYDATGIIDEDFNTKYNMFENISIFVNSSKAATEESGSLNPIGGILETVKALGTVISLTFKVLMLPGAMLYHAANDVPYMPPGIAEILFVLPLLIITIAIVFIILSAFSRGKL